MPNSIKLIYREFTPEFSGATINVSTPSNVYTAVRKTIKPFLPDLKLKPNNSGGEGASNFNRNLGRFGFHWLDFLLPEYQATAIDFPTDQELVKLGVLKDTEIATKEGWRKKLAESVANGEVFLLVGLEALLDRNKIRLSGIPSKCYPLELKVHECVVTHAPVCQYIRYRSHVIA
ncbi:hypothetical protein KO528_08865 [Saccharophagus degradans]|uniref:hypothetical protein n=1 Tax=Saccharophagus degradans TaxID=86304 RepID=UPI001C09D806|nr:hypothetical protein [Saccharophagus degradans]MBU2985462.1 hypothetical protein [Saccharophagus degradans]